MRSTQCGSNCIQNFSLPSIIAPHSTPSVRPWMTPYLLQLSHTKKWLYRRLKSCSFDDKDWFAEHKIAPNAANNSFWQLLNEYFHGFCINYKNNPTPLGKVIRYAHKRRNIRSRITVSPVRPEKPLRSRFGELKCSLESCAFARSFVVVFFPTSLHYSAWMREKERENKWVKGAEECRGKLNSVL